MDARLNDPALRSDCGGNALRQIRLVTLAALTITAWARCGLPAHADVVGAVVGDAKFTEEAVSPGGDDFKDFQQAPGAARSSDASDPDFLPPFSVHVSASTTISIPSHFGALASGDGANEGGHSEAKVVFSVAAVEIAPPPGFVDFIPVDVIGKLMAGAEAQGGGPSGQTIGADGTASFFLNQQEALTVSCASSLNQCNVLKQDGQSISKSQLPDTSLATATFNFSFKTGLFPNQVVMGIADAAVDLGGANGPLEEGTALSTLASALSDPVIEIDPSFAFKDDFKLVFSSNLFAPTGGVPEPSSWLLFAAGIGLLATLQQVRNPGRKRLLRRSPSHGTALDRDSFLTRSPICAPPTQAACP